MGSRFASMQPLDMAMVLRSVLVCICGRVWQARLHPCSCASTFVYYAAHTGLLSTANAREPFNYTDSVLPQWTGEVNYANSISLSIGFFGHDR